MSLKAKIVMNIVLLQTRLSSEEIDHLLREFPQYLFLSFTEHTYKNLSRDDWGRVEILFGGRLNQEELAMAHQLHWIHTPSPYLHRLCLDDIHEQGNILVTTTQEENIGQIGEYVMGGVLAFGKNLFAWRDLGQIPQTIWDSKLRETMWTLKDRLFLQVGMGRIGKEITREAQTMGMRVWGVQPRRSFQPYCDRVYAMQDLHSVLPNADVVCLCLPRGQQYKEWFKAAELERMKEDSILIVIGPHNIVAAHDLLEVANTGKFRGIMLDAHYEVPVPMQSDLWKVPNLILTPEVAPRPKSSLEQSFRIFRYNMRQYLHGNFSDMRNLVEAPQVI